MDQNNFQSGQQNVSGATSATPIPVQPKKSFNLKVWLPIIVVVVLVGGYFVFDYVKHSFLIPPTDSRISPTPTVSSTPDPTADWKTYTNSQYGFEFKYPNDKSVNTSANDVLVLNQGDPGVIILRMNFVPIGSSIGDNETSWEQITLNGKRAFKRSFATETWIVTELYVNPNGIQSKELRIITPNSNMSLSDQILSTFKFTK